MPNEQMAAKLRGTTWYCEAKDVGVLFGDDNIFYILYRLGGINTLDNGFLLDEGYDEYNWIDNNQIWIYYTYTDIICDNYDGFYCPTVKLSVEKFTESELDVQIICVEGNLFLNSPVGTKFHFIRNDTMPIYSEEDLERQDMVTIDTTFLLPRAEIVHSELQNSIIGFWNQTRNTTESTFLEARCNTQNDSVIVTITDEVTFPYSREERLSRDSIQTKFVAMVADSIPVVFLGVWPRQFLVKSQGTYPFILCFNKYARYLRIRYEPCDKYLKNGSSITKKYPKTFY